MSIQCTPPPLAFHAFGRRQVVGRFDAGRLTSDGGTLLLREVAGPQRLYEHLYCARGDMENRIEECQLDLFADRTSTATLRANQLRLYFASFAYVLMHGLRRLGLAGTRWAQAQCGTLRVNLLKVAARIRITARKVWLSFSSVYPYRDAFTTAAGALFRGPTRAPPA